VNFLFRPLVKAFPTLGKALSFTHKLYLFIYQSTVLSSHAVDGHEIYFGGSIVGKDLTVDIEISPTPFLIFTGGGSKSAKFGVVFNITQL